MLVDERASFIHFVYPFLFEVETFATRVEAIQQAQWQRRGRLLAVWQTECFPEDELLAHVAHFLNPAAGTLATARVWKLRDDLQDDYGLATRADWQLQQLRSVIPFRFGDVGSGVFAAQLVVCPS